MTSILIIASDEIKANRLKNALAPDGYQFDTVLDLDGPLPTVGIPCSNLAILWFPYSSPEALPDLENLVHQIQSLGEETPIPVLLIIDQYGSHWVEPGFRLGVTDILTRPIHPLVLRQRVRLLLKAQETEQAIARYQRTERALKAERGRLFVLLDLLPVYVFLQAADFSVSFANRTFRHLFGEPGTQKCYEILQNRAEPCPDCPSLVALATGVQQKWEWVLPDGRTYMVYNSPFTERDGTTQSLEIGVDITELKQTEMALRTEEERFRTVADFTYDWEYWSAPNGQMIYNSPACERVTGYTTQAFQTSPGLLLDIVHPEDRDRVREHLGREAQTGDTYALDFRILTRSGEERWIGHVCQPVYGKDGVPSGRRVSNRDITERKLAEQALVRSERLAAIGRLAASLAHEINNPLQAMYSSIELVMDFPLGDDERQQYLEIVRTEIERLMKINSGILEFSRPPQLEVRLAAIHPVIDHALFLARAQMKSGRIETIRDIPEDLPFIMIAPDQLSQVFLNLIINAVEHMPQGGSLEIHAEKDEHQLLVTFTDSGTGIPPDILELIFDPFYSTKANGTGLGLAISQGIIQRLGGTLSAHNFQGGGSTFTVTLPLLMPQDPLTVGESDDRI